MRIYNSTTILRCTFCVSFLVLFNVVKGQEAFDFESCATVNEPESIEVTCKGHYKYLRDCSRLFFANVSEENRSKVVKLRSFGCVESFYIFPKLFKNVRVLDISNNRIGNLSSEILNHPHLEKLFASHCHIHSIDFVNIPNVIEIDLSHNELTQISDNVSKLKHFKRLDLSFNSIQHVPLVKNMTLNMENNKMDELNGRHFVFIKNNVTLRLSLDKIYSFNNNRHGLNCAPILHRIDVDGENVIFRIIGNKTLRLSSRQFQHIRKFSFRQNHFGNIPELLDAMGPNVRHLDLASNSIGKISNTTFQRFRELTYLDLDNTNLTIIEPKASVHLFRFDFLNLSNNNLKHVDLSLISYLPKKITLRNIIGENIQEKIKSLPSSIAVLDVSSNYIGKLKADTFKHLTNLRWLNLRNTSLLEIEADAYEQFNNLLRLDLSHNYLKQLNFSASAKKSQLLRLWLQENELDLNLDSITREGFPHLGYLNLSLKWLSCEYLESFSKRMDGLNITSSGNEKCYNGADDILQPDLIETSSREKEIRVKWEKCKTLKTEWNELDEEIVEFKLDKIAKY